MKNDPDCFYSLVLQSSDTGKFLLRKRDEVWGFAVKMENDPNKGMLFEGLNELKSLLNFPQDFDDFVVDYVQSFNAGQDTVFHVLVRGEPSVQDGEWHSLFDFPEPFDPTTDSFFDNAEFINRIVSPDY